MTFHGLFVPLITPFAADGTVALPALETLAHDLLDDGAAGLVALGTTGEPSALTPAERAAVLSLVERVSRDRRTPWIAGVHDSVVPTTADAAMHAVPPFVRPGEEGVVAHFTAVAAASPIPVVVYHVPCRTAQPLPAEALLRLVSLPNVTAMKYAPGALDTTTMTFLAAAAALPDFAVLAGDDVLAGPLLALGATGAIMAAAHVTTAGYAALIAAWHAGPERAGFREGGPGSPAGTDRPGEAGGLGGLGDTDGPGDRNDPGDAVVLAGPGGHAGPGGNLDRLAVARRLSHRLVPQSAALFAAPNPTVIKAVLHADGRIPSAAVRLPLVPPAPDLVALVREARTASLT
jgi:4-hydroxy-tetrahydrodipicolinate synthase